MKQLFFNLFIGCALCIACAACQKEEGEGGRSVLQGNVQLIQHPNDTYTLRTDTVAAAKTDVFIVFGNDEMYGDDMKTDAEGNYRFPYLRKGTYTVYAYSTLSTGEKIAVSQRITVGRNETKTLPVIYIHEGKAYGTSIVRGQVWANYIHNGNARGSGWAYEHRVYIRRSGETYHFDDVRVGEDGYFYFQQLLPGTYEIYTVTEDANEVPSLLRQSITVNESGKIYELEKMFSVTINV